MIAVSSSSRDSSAMRRSMGVARLATTPPSPRMLMNEPLPRVAMVCQARPVSASPPQRTVWMTISLAWAFLTAFFQL
jgi:hypothetical protein